MCLGLENASVTATLLGITWHDLAPCRPLPLLLRSLDGLIGHSLALPFAVGLHSLAFGNNLLQRYASCGFVDEDCIPQELKDDVARLRTLLEGPGRERGKREAEEERTASNTTHCAVCCVLCGDASDVVLEYSGVVWVRRAD